MQGSCLSYFMLLRFSYISLGQQVAGIGILCTSSNKCHTQPLDVHKFSLEKSHDLSLGGT